MNRRQKGMLGLIACAVLMLVIVVIILGDSTPPAVTEASVAQAPPAPWPEPEVPDVGAMSDKVLLEEPIDPAGEIIEASAAKPQTEAADMHQPAETAVVPDKPLQVRILVLEEETEVPLQGVRVRLAKESDPDPETGELPIPSELREPLSAMTNETGRAVFTGVPPDVYQVELRYGSGPRVTDESDLEVTSKDIDWTCYYTARIPFTFRILDETGNPVANAEYEAGLTTSWGWGGRGGEGNTPGIEIQWQQVMTDSEGRFTVLAYEDMRGAALRSDRPEIFSPSFSGEGGESRLRNWMSNRWTNPFFDMRRLSAERENTIVARTDVVIATGVLVDAPEPDSVAGYSAVLRDAGGGGRERAVPLGEPIGVVDDRFTFLASLEQELEVTIQQSIPVGEGTRRSIEKTERVVMPEEPGPFEFEIRFGESAEVEGVVLMPDGSPASGVTVEAWSYNQAQEASQSPPRGRWGGLPDGTMARQVAPPTDRKGRFRLTVPQAATYRFETEGTTLPEDAKGCDPVTVGWEEIKAGKLIELRLKPSSLIWGEVVDLRGYPVPGTQVNLRGPDIPWNSPDFRVETDSEGIFELNIPPIRLAEPDPEEPPSHYLFAWHRVYGGGLGQVFIDQADKPVLIDLAPFTTIAMTVTESGAPVTEIEFQQLYSVPGFDMPITARNSGRRRNFEGRYRFPFLIQGISSVTVWRRDAEEQAQTVFVDLNSPDPLEVTVDLPAGPSLPSEPE